METPTFEMLINDENLDGVFAISLVDKPAIMKDYILLSENELDKVQIEVKLEKIIDEKEHVLCGPALIPDIIIPRNGYNITFSTETIKKISENFLINNYKDNVTIQHQSNVNKVNLVESWIIKDSEKDKAATLGFNDLPAGTWMVSFKVNDDELWENYLASGILKGFSIEGNFSRKKHELHLHDNCHQHDLMTDEDQELFEIYLAMNYTKEELEQLYVWRLGPNENHCPSCIRYNNQIHKLKEWAKIAIPREVVGQRLSTSSNVKTIYYDENGKLIRRSKKNPKGTGKAYGTFCEDRCGCILQKVEAKIIRPVISTPKRKF